MDFPIAALADLANVDAGGKLNIIGIFSALNVPGFPFILPMMFVSLLMEVEGDQKGQRVEVSVQLIGSDGMKHLEQGPFQVMVPNVEGDDQPVTIPMVLRVDQLKINKADNYQWVVRVDHEIMKSLSMRVQSRH